jgi:hypothetical protein
VRLKKKYLVVAGILVGLATILSINVDTRVTRIDFNKLYSTTNIYERDYGHKVLAREYPSQDILGFYVFPTQRGTMWISCIARDYDKHFVGSNSRRVGPTSQVIGDESFFEYQGIDSRLTLAYRRFNVIAYFKDDPKFELHNGSANTALEADKKELESTAKILDDAILKKNPAIGEEQVPAFWIVWTGVRDWIGGMIFLMLWRGQHC